MQYQLELSGVDVGVQPHGLDEWISGIIFFVSLLADRKPRQYVCPKDAGTQANPRMAQRLKFTYTNGTLIRTNRFIMDANVNRTYFITAETDCQVIPGVLGLGSNCFGTAYGHKKTGEVVPLSAPLCLMETPVENNGS